MSCVSLILLEKMEVGNFISERFHTLIVLRFLVNTWCLCQLCVAIDSILVSRGA